MNTSVCKTLIAPAAIALVLAAAGAAHAGSLENMERERAIMIEAMLTADLTPAERFLKIAVAKRRLVDLERMVLRDKKLVGRNTPTVRRAFGNYELTFMVHAAAENNASVIDVWMAQVGLTTQTVMSARRSRR